MWLQYSLRNTNGSVPSSDREVPSPWFPLQEKIFKEKWVRRGECKKEKKKKNPEKGKLSLSFQAHPEVKAKDFNLLLQQGDFHTLSEYSYHFSVVLNADKQWKKD